MSVSIYLACYMTGLTGKEIWEEYMRVRPIYERHGITVVSPVEGEAIVYDDHVNIDRSDQEAITVWKNKDKEQIRNVHACVFPAKQKASQGIIREYGLSRYHLKKPSVWVYERMDHVKPGFISRAEDDYVATSHEEAALVIVSRWGTRKKRVMWRFRMLLKTLPQRIKDWLWEWK